MPTWGDILAELGAPANRLPNGNANHDKLRREYLARLYKLTGRPVIVYASGFLEKPAETPDMSITLGDIQGFMNALADIQDKNLDLIITSPGGSPEATESIVAYLRTRFDNIRAFIPVAAMSAATMLALGCDEIVMGAHSQLGRSIRSSRCLRQRVLAALQDRPSLSSSRKQKRNCKIPKTSAHGCLS